MISASFYTDFYKTQHHLQYPKGLTKVYSNFTPRISRMDRVTHVVVFGIQYFIEEYLVKRFDETFFKRDKMEVLKEYSDRMKVSIGAISTLHLAELHDVGYLPLHIKALPEGTLCPLKTPVLTITNTDDRFFWLPNFLETILSNVLWHPITSATIAYEYRKVLTQYAKRTSDDEEFVKFQGHDFSMRGQTSFESACVNGAAHLTSFVGTDTLPALEWLGNYYAADTYGSGLIGTSVPATEHSIMCFGGKATELETFERLITETYPKGIVSIVSDTWNYWDVLTKTLPSLREKIMKRDGKLVIRPDSGNPSDIICGDVFKTRGSPEYRGSIELLWELFGGKINSKGYKELDPHIGLIYGDNITLDLCQEICDRLSHKGFASTNVIFGIGSYTYQYVTRDTFGFAMKATYGVIDGVPQEIFKDPITDGGVKKSAKGLLRVNEDMSLSECVLIEDEQTGKLKSVFKDGMRWCTNFNQIRSRIEESLT